jgi:hypothetical protein
VQVGDTILSINDLRISDTFMQSLSYSVVPGDNVRLRVRRNGRERQLAVTASERPAAYAEPRDNVYLYEISPDSIRRRMNLYMDSARIAIDTLHFPRMRVERIPGGGMFMYSDSVRVRMLPRDSAFGRVGPGEFGVLTFSDTSFFRGATPFPAPPRGGRLMRVDSMNRMFLDSATLQLRSQPGGRIFGWTGDSLVTYSSRGGATASFFGIRAVGGAELTELNPGLGEYFGTDAGVLVVRVPDETPAARAGLQPGDVVVRANGTDVADVNELRRVITNAGREPIRLEIIRKKARRTIELRND